MALLFISYAIVYVYAIWYHLVSAWNLQDFCVGQKQYHMTCRV